MITKFFRTIDRGSNPSLNDLLFRSLPLGISQPTLNLPSKSCLSSHHLGRKGLDLQDESTCQEFGTAAGTFLLNLPYGQLSVRKTWLLGAIVHASTKCAGKKQRRHQGTSKELMAKNNFIELIHDK